MYLFHVLLLLIDFRERKREREKHHFVVPHQNLNLGVSGWCSGQLSYPARACMFDFLLFIHVLEKEKIGREADKEWICLRNAEENTGYIQAVHLGDFLRGGENIIHGGGVEQKGKRTMDMDNSVVIAAG